MLNGSSARSYRAQESHAILGNPFRGSSKAKWSNIGKGVADWLPGIHVTKGLPQNFETNSEKLALLGDEIP